MEDIKKLGAKEAIVTNKENWAEDWAFQFDFILNCSDMTNTFDMKTYLSTLKVGGEFHMVGLPDEPLPEIMAQMFAANAAKLTGSHLGNHQEMDALLKLAAEKNIRPWYVCLFYKVEELLLTNTKGSRRLTFRKLVAKRPLSASRRIKCITAFRLLATTRLLVPRNRYEVN